MVRRVFPRPRDPWLDATIPAAPQDVEFAAAYESALHESERSDTFARGRFEDGRRWRSILDRARAGDGLILDLASGSGGVALALAAGYWEENRPKSEEDLTRKMFPEN